jgi:hypothetical protein
VFIKASWKWLTITKALAHYTIQLITDVISFVIQATGFLNESFTSVCQCYFVRSLRGLPNKCFVPILAQIKNAIVMVSFKEQITFN